MKKILNKIFRWTCCSNGTCYTPSDDWAAAVSRLTRQRSDAATFGSAVATALCCRFPIDASAE